MLTEKDYCDYDTYVALKELGYVGICDAYYELTGNDSYNRDSFELLYTRDFIHPDDKDRVAAPLLYQAQKWLREEKGIFVYIDVPWKTDGGLGWSYFCCNKPMTEEDKEVCFASGGFYDSYEEALSEGIKQSIKILKEK